MNSILKNQIEKSLALVISNLKSEKEAQQFLHSFLTTNELKILSKRLAVTYWLIKKRNYANIKNNLKVTTKTISETEPLLKKPSIQKAIKNLDADVWADKWSQKLRSVITKTHL